MSFLIYDITFLIIFVLFISIFLYSRRKKLKREGLAFLYKTKIGTRFIDYANRKLKKILPILSWLSITSGYLLMIAMLYLIFILFSMTIKFPSFFKAIKVPPLIPLVPYLPKIFNIDFLPPFYFTYWVIAIAIIAIFHEFSHGIFGRFNKLKIKSTGFGFLGPFLLAFVELDEKKMEKKKKLAQIAVLSAGSFANIIATAIFLLIMWLFFSLTFVEGGAFFDSYTLSPVNISQVSSIEDSSISDPTIESLSLLLKNKNFSQDFIFVRAGNKKFLIEPSFLEQQLKTKASTLLLYDDMPAINARLKGIITEFNSVEIKNNDELAAQILKYRPGNKVSIKTRTDGDVMSYSITLAEHPQNRSRAFLGIGMQARGSGILSRVQNLFVFFKAPSTNYLPRINKELAIFIYNLLWWLVLINVSVALFNMLPFAIFDGGRVFYLTILGLIKSKNRAKRICSIVNYLIVLAFLILMLIWFFTIL